MRRKIVAAVFAAALVGVVGAEGIIKARQATLPKGSITVEEIESVSVSASRPDSTIEQVTVIAAASM